MVEWYMQGIVRQNSTRIKQIHLKLIIISYYQ